MISKSSLAIELSKLKLFSNPKVSLEQYSTDSEIASDVLWNAYMKGDIKDKIIIDAGCGTGILGIGCLFLGAKKVFFVDIDENALKTCKENLEEYDYDNNEIIKSEISKITLKADMLIQNPPFGSQNKHADRVFLEKAITYPIAYSFHMKETDDFIRKFTKQSKITQSWKYSFPLKSSMEFHTKKITRIDVNVYRFEKQKHI